MKNHNIDFSKGLNENPFDERTNSIFDQYGLNVLSTFRTLVIIVFLSSTVRASVNGYCFSTSTGVSLTGGAFTTILSTYMDDDVSAMTNIGFTFNYNGTNYTQFSATSNGLLRFGASAITDYNNLFTSLVGAYLMPYWDDNYTDADGNIRYQLSGVAGSRKLVVDYNLSYLGNTGTADKHFQIWLFETSNNIQFVYGVGNNFNDGFSVGIATNGLLDFMSVTVSGNTVSTLLQNDNNTTWPGSGKSYNFNPGVGLPIQFTSFEYNCQETNIALDWRTESEKNCAAFEIEASRDGYEYSTIGVQNGNGTTSHASDYLFTISKNYANHYLRLKQVDTDGNYTIYGPFIIACNPEKVSIYPNPADEQISIVCPESFAVATVFVCDYKGNVLSETQHDFKNSNMKLIDLEEYVAGMYLIKIKTDKETTVYQVAKK